MPCNRHWVGLILLQTLSERGRERESEWVCNPRASTELIGNLNKICQSNVTCILLLWSECAAGWLINTSAEYIVKLNFRTVLTRLIQKPYTKLNLYNAKKLLQFFLSNLLYYGNWVLIGNWCCEYKRQATHPAKINIYSEIEGEIHQLFYLLKLSDYIYTWNLITSARLFFRAFPSESQKESLWYTRESLRAVNLLILGFSCTCAPVANSLTICKVYIVVKFLLRDYIPISSAVNSLITFKIRLLLICKW